MLTSNSQITYYKTSNYKELSRFSRNLTSMISSVGAIGQQIIVLCIGTDRATGDSLGPMIGYKLAKYRYNDVIVYGSLKEPVHAKNLEETLLDIQMHYDDPLIIAIDASLGNQSHIGMITLCEGSLQPGSGVNKDLPEVGDIHITGIVNFSGFMEMIVLQNTRLNVVMELADFITRGINLSLISLEKSNNFAL